MGAEQWGVVGWVRGGSLRAPKYNTRPAAAQPAPVAVQPVPAKVQPQPTDTMWFAHLARDTTAVPCTAETGVPSNAAASAPAPPPLR